MSRKLRTYLDSGVVLAVARGEPGADARAYAVLNDPRREFVTSDAFVLEVMPNAIYFNQALEQQLCQDYVDKAVQRIEFSQQLFEEAFRQASTHGIAALDALHIASAITAQATEFITTEKPSKPLYRVTQIKVTHLLSI